MKRAIVSRGVPPTTGRAGPHPAVRQDHRDGARHVDGVAAG